MFCLQFGQIRQMEEVKISKKSKVGILPFVTGFEEFAELAETIFRNAERRGDLDKAYVKVIRAVFVNGETLSHSDYYYFYYYRLLHILTGCYFLAKSDWYLYVVNI